MPKTTMNPSDQRTDSYVVSSRRRRKRRVASTIFVIGLCSAMGCSQLGIESTGTKAEETKVSGKMMVKP